MLCVHIRSQWQKYFKNNNFAAATYKAKGGLQHIILEDVRWSTLADCLESYLKHWPILLTICEENKAIIDKNITNIANNFGVEQSAEELLQMLKPIDVSLDLMQKDSFTIHGSVMIWKNLQKELTPKLSQGAKKNLSKVIEQAMTPAHFLANIVILKYSGKDLTDKEIKIEMSFSASKMQIFFHFCLILKQKLHHFKSLYSIIKLFKL